MIQVNSETDRSLAIHESQTDLNYNDPNGTAEDLLWWLKKFKKLTRLYVSAQHMEALPSFPFPDLEYLRLYTPHLQVFPEISSEKLYSVELQCDEVPVLPARLIISVDIRFQRMKEFALANCWSRQISLHSEKWDGTLHLSERCNETLERLTVLAPKAIVSDLSKFHKLVDFNWQTALPISMQWPAALKSLSIYSQCPAQTTPLGLEQTPDLTRLFLTGNFSSDCYQGMEDCHLLLGYYSQGKSNFPDQLKELTGLESLRICESTVTTIPDWLVRFPKLKNVDLRNNPILTKIPSDWSGLVSLETLAIRHNAITDESFVYTLPKSIKSISLAEQFSDQYFSLNIKWTLPLKDHIGFPGKRIEELNTFASALAKTDFSKDDKMFFFSSWLTEKAPSVEDWPLYKTIQGLSVSWKPFLDVLYKHLITLPRTIESLRGRKLFLDGNFTEKKTSLKEQLKLLEATVANEISSADVVVLGKSPEAAWKYLKDNSVALLLETQFYGLLKEADTGEKFLVDDSENFMLENLISMLGSPELSNVQIGLQMVKTGGVPKDLLPVLLYIGKTHQETSVRNEVKKIIEPHIPERWIPIFRDKQTFKTDDKEKELRAKLEKLEKSAGVDCAVELAFILGTYARKGLAYVLALKKSPHRETALKMLTENGELDFHRGIGYHNWKNDDPSTVMLSSVKTGIAFPSDHPDPLSIRKLNFHNCKFDSLSKDVTVFKEVQEIDLSVNNLKALPLQLKQLSRLRHLDVSLNRLTQVPSVLFDMPQLRFIDLRYNDGGSLKGGASGLEGLEELRKALPDCEIKI